MSNANGTSNAHNDDSQGSGEWVTSASSNGGTISPLELESLTQLDEHSHVRNKNAGLDRLAASSLPHNPFDRVLLMIKLMFQLYPKMMFGGVAFLMGVLLFIWSPWQSWSNARYARNYMTHDYTALEENFSFQTAQIDHWCLFGGDDRCYCEDPTEGQSRSETRGWTTAHKRNKQLVTQAMGQGAVDVVFLGDQTVQSWDGLWLDRPAPDGRRIAQYWNKTFNSPQSTFQGVALGIYGDRLNNILWRIQHGEVPTSLRPKVFWLVMGTNDLALGLCSEEVVTLGIMRIAEEIHHLFPDSVVVIQGILPRSNHPDGTLDGKISKYASRTPGQRHSHHVFHKARGDDKDKDKEGQGRGTKRTIGAAGGGYGDGLNPYGVPGGRDRNLFEKKADIKNSYREIQSTTEESTTEDSETDGARGGLKWRKKKHNDDADGDKRAPQPHFNYYLWPSIQAINKELEGFCAKHEHLVYFDADDLVLGSVGNSHYRAPHKAIITELMPNYVHLSYMGHKVVIDVLNEELKRIIMDDDENNDIETKSGSTSSSSASGGAR